LSYARVAAIEVQTRGKLEDIIFFCSSLDASELGGVQRQRVLVKWW